MSRFHSNVLDGVVQVGVSLPDWQSACLGGAIEKENIGAERCAPAPPRRAADRASIDDTEGRTRLAEQGLSPRLVTALLSNGIDTPERLRATPDAKLSLLRGIGRGGMTEIARWREITGV